MSREVMRTAQAAEVEGVFVLPSSEAEAWARDGQYHLQGSGMVTGTPTSCQEMMPEMLAYYGGLKPMTDEEAQTQKRWMTYVREYITPEDVINFKAYHGLSRACLWSLAL